MTENVQQIFTTILFFPFKLESSNHNTKSNIMAEFFAAEGFGSFILINSEH